MFRKLFNKLIGSNASIIADNVVTGALDKATGGISTAVEKAIVSGKVKQAKGAIETFVKGGKSPR
jgi:hypothetical protein